VNEIDERADLGVLRGARLEPRQCLGEFQVGAVDRLGFLPLPRLQQLGANMTLNPEDKEWRQTLKKALAPRRVDLAIDNIGGNLLPEVIETLGELGKVSLVGRLAGAVPDFNTASLFFRRLRMGGVTAGAYTAAEAQSTWQEIVKLLERTGAKPLVDSVFAFNELLKAFAKLAQGPMGKVLLEVPV